MTPDDPRRDEERDQALNPHRAEERARAADEIAGRLRDRLIDVDGSEDPDELARLMEAVDEFEGAVRARGGDSFVDTPKSSQPYNPAWVVPRRRADEPLGVYAARIRLAAQGIASGETASRPEPGSLGPGTGTA